jgi:hypothetical protein
MTGRSWDGSSPRRTATSRPEPPRFHIGLIANAANLPSSWEILHRPVGTSNPRGGTAREVAWVR